MVVEMLLLCLVPVPSAWVFPALLLNRLVSGAAEALASGVDEALAHDSLDAAGLAGEWPRVLERLIQAGAVVTIVSMVVGSLLYDPRPLNGLATALGLPPGLTAADTFRLPVWCTLGSAVGVVGVMLAMREPAFGLVGAGSAALGLLAAGPIRRLAMRASLRTNFLVLVGITLVGLVGTACFVPWWGVVFVMLLSLTMRMVVFLQSHYLNQLVASERRATVLSFRGLAVNVSYGLMSLAFAAAVAGWRPQGRALQAS